MTWLTSGLRLNATATGTLILALTLICAILPQVPVQAQPSAPSELDLLCVEREDKVLQATSPSDCGRREVLVDVPAERPVHLCGRDDFGLVRYTTDPAACTRDHEFPITIPDDGPVILCSKNIKNGRVKPTGELRFADNVARCDSKFYTPFITPAAPDAVADTHTTDEDTPLTVAAGGVLDNDADASGGPLTARLVDDVDVGALSLSSDGGFTYDPRGLFDDLDVGQSRDVRFTYATSDGELESDPAIVTITVTGRNDRPVGTPDAYDTDEDSALQVVRPGVLGNDLDAEPGELSSHLVDDVSVGQLQLETDGGFRYDPAGAFEHLGAGQALDATFTYVARDGSDDAAATAVTVTVHGVNDAPVAADDAFTTDENTLLTITPAQLLDNDADVEGDALDVIDVVAGSPVSAFDIQPDGTVVLDPRAAFDDLEDGQTGLATFTYAAHDGDTASGRATVTITVTGISGPTANDDTATTDEDTPVDIDILANDLLPAGADVEITSQGSHGGTVTLIDGVANYDPGNEFDDLPDGQSRLDTFTYAISNVEGTDGATVSVLVEGRNDAPTAGDQTIGPIDTTSSELFSPGVMVGAEDPDSTDLTAILVSPPERGRLTLHPDGTFDFDPAGEVLSGQVQFRYRLSDGQSESATGTITLDADVDQLPVIAGQTFVVFNGEDPLTVGLQVVASDQPNNAISFALGAPSTYFAISSAGVLTLTQGMPPLGDYDLVVRVTDDAGQIAQAVVTVSVQLPFAPTDDDFEAIGNTQSVGGLVPDPAIPTVVSAVGLTANDGDPARVTAVAGTITTALGGSLAVEADGAFTYTPPRPGATITDLGCGAGAISGTYDGATPITDCVPYQVLDQRTNDMGSAVATFELHDIVWYVDLEATTPGDGTAAMPFDDLAVLDGSGGPDTTGDILYVQRGSGSAPIALQDGQQLLGRGVPLAPAGIPLIGADPDLVPVLGGTVTLAQDNELRGFTIAGAQEGVVSAHDLSTADPADVLPAGGAKVDIDSISVNGATALRLGSGNVGVEIGALLAVADGGMAIDLRDTAGQVALGTVEAPGAIGLTGTNDGVADATVTITGAQIQPAALTPSDGLAVVGWAGGVMVDTLDTQVSGTAVRVDDLAADGSVTLGALTGVGGRGGIRSVRNAGTITVDEVSLTELDLGHDDSGGLEVVDNMGDIVVNDGLISAPIPADLDADAELMSVIETGTVDTSASPGHVRNDAALQLGAPDDGPSGSRVRAFEVVDLTAGATVTQHGPIISRGAGLYINGNTIGSLTSLTGGSDIQTILADGHVVLPATQEEPVGVGLYVAGSELAMTGGHRLSSAGGPALRMVGTTIDAQGVFIDSATSTDARFVQNSLNAVGIGIDLLGLEQDGATTPPLLVSGGAVTDAGRLGVRIQEADGVTLGAVAVTAPQQPVDANGDPQEDAMGDPVQGGIGVLVRRSDDVRLAGSRVARSAADGIVADRIADLTLDGVSVTDSNGRGVVLPDVEGTTTLRGLSVGSSEEEALAYTATDALSAPATLLIRDSSFGGSPAEHDTGLVDVEDATVVLDIGGDNASAFTGGRNALNVEAREGADVTADVTRTTFSSASEDGLRLFGTGAATTVDYTVTDLRPESQGGLQSNGHAGFSAVARDDATVSGLLARVQSASDDEYGVLLDGADGSRLEQVTVTADKVSIGVQNTADVVIDRADVTGAPQGHGIELWGTRDVLITGSRVDFRNLPDPPGQEVDADGDPVKEDDQERRALQQPQQSCTAAQGAARRNTILDIFDLAPLVVDGVSGIFARHTAGSLTITDTTVRGATLHQITVFNGTALEPAYGPFGNQVNTTTGNAVPGVADPAPRPAPRFGTTPTMTLNVGDLVLLDHHVGRAGLFAGAGPGGRTSVAYQTTTSEQSVSAHLFCSVDGGVTTATGSPSFDVSGYEPGLIAKASGSGAQVYYDLDEVTITYDPDERNAILDLLEALGIDVASLFAVQAITEFGGTVAGSLAQITVNNAPGNAYLIQDSGEYGPITAVNPGVHGVVVQDVVNANISDVTVTTPGSSGVFVRRSENINLVTVDVDEPAAHGLDVAESRDVTIDGLVIDSPSRAAVQAASVDGLSVSSAELTAAGPGGDGPRSAVHARNVLPLTLRGIEADGFDALPVDVVNGSAYPGVPMEELGALPCQLPPIPSDGPDVTPSGDDCIGDLTLSSLTTIASTMAGDTAVSVRSGSDVAPAIKVGGIDWSLDGGVALESTDSAVTVGSAGPATILADVSSDVLSITRTDPGAPDTDLVVDLTGLTIQRAMASGAQIGGDGLAVSGASSTTLTSPTIGTEGDPLSATPSIDGPVGDAINVDAGELTITGGHLSRVGGDGVRYAGADLSISGTSVVRAAGDGIRMTPPGGGSSSAMISSPTIARVGDVAIRLVGVDDVDLTGTTSQPTIVSPTGKALRIQEATTVDVADVTVNVDQGNVTDRPFTVTAAGSPSARCTSLTDNTVVGTVDKAFELTNTGLFGYTPFSQTVSQWLTANGNTPNTVEATNVISC